MGEKSPRRPPPSWGTIALAAAGAFLLGAVLRPQWAAQLGGAAQQARATATGPLFSGRAGNALQYLGRREEGFAKRPDAEVMMPLLTARELLTLQYYARGAERYLEWGSGASTFIVAPMAKRAWSVDNHKPWCETMQREKVALKFWEAEGVLHHTCVDTGPTKDFGMPAKGVSLEEKKRYVDVVDTFGQPTFDAVLIDGRYRVACALKVLPYLTDASVVMVHDWEERWEIYHEPLLHFYEAVEEVDRLAVLRRRTGWDAKAAAEMLEEYYPNPA